ncbi:MAG: hypothetical protein ABI811_22895 [Acidobacteriota bacterium]
MKKTCRIVTRAAKESTSITEQFCQPTGRSVLVNLIENACQEVSNVMHQILWSGAGIQPGTSCTPSNFN